PALRCDRERLLRGFLGEVEIAEEADQRREDPPPLVPKRPFEDRYQSLVGRISIAPPIRAAGIRAASSIAASRSSASNVPNPSSASLVSTNGPSVVSVFPSCPRTVVAVSGGARPMPGVTPGVSLSCWKPSPSCVRSSGDRFWKSRTLGPRLISSMYFIASSFVE